MFENNNDDGFVIEKADFRVIMETSKYILGHLWEQAYLYDKVNMQETLLCEFYGVCDAGVINEIDEWCVVGGDVIAVWKKGEISIIDKRELAWVNDMRIKDNNTVEILIDPWSEYASIWELSINNLYFRKISDFCKYKHLPYTVNVEW